VTVKETLGFGYTAKDFSKRTLYSMKPLSIKNLVTFLIDTLPPTEYVELNEIHPLFPKELNPDSYLERIKDSERHLISVPNLPPRLSYPRSFAFAKKDILHLGLDVKGYNHIIRLTDLETACELYAWNKTLSPLIKPLDDFTYEISSPFSDETIFVNFTSDNSVYFKKKSEKPSLFSEKPVNYEPLILFAAFYHKFNSSKGFDKPLFFPSLTGKFNRIYDALKRQSHFKKPISSLALDAYLFQIVKELGTQGLLVFDTPPPNCFVERYIDFMVSDNADIFEKLTESNLSPKDFYDRFLKKSISNLKDSKKRYLFSILAKEYLNSKDPVQKEFLTILRTDQNIFPNSSIDDLLSNRFFNPNMPAEIMCQHMMIYDKQNISRNIIEEELRKEQELKKEQEIKKEQELKDEKQIKDDGTKDLEKNPNGNSKPLSPNSKNTKVRVQRKGVDRKILEKIATLFPP